jgi:putative SOS response-associated peptidase YedK
MCGRYTLTKQEKLEEAFQASLEAMILKDAWWKPRFNVAPTQPAPVITLRDGVRHIELFKWGLTPHWAASSGKRPPLMINARAETLTEKPVFRDALARRRCLVPADGFFEWQRKAGTPPQALYFHPRDHLIAFAGLWARARTDQGETMSFTIITVPPNELVAPVHDRMPCVLSPEAYAAWLDPATSIDAAHAMLGTPPIADWQADPVSSHVNKVDHDDPRCIELALAEAPRQTSLF